MFCDVVCCLCPFLCSLSSFLCRVGVVVRFISIRNVNYEYKAHVMRRVVVDCWIVMEVMSM